MYGKNDYRDYLEHRLAESDDFLAHYGVKGMKWRKRKNTTMALDQERGMKRTADLGYTPAGDGKTFYYSHNKRRKVQNYKPKRTQSVGTNTNSVKTRIRDLARRRRAKSNAQKSIFDRSVWKRSKSKGKKLSKKSNITVSHNTTIK